MATAPHPVEMRSVIVPRIHSPCDFIQTLMKLQRAAQLITSTLDLDALLDRVVNDLAESIGGVEVAVWLRDSETDEMVLCGVRGCTQNGKGSRLKIGLQGMVGHVARIGKLHYAPDVRLDPYYIGCEPDTRSEMDIPLVARGETIGVLSVAHHEVDAFADEQSLVLQAFAGHISVAIENARLFKLERLERDRMRREAEDARAIQQALFPMKAPVVPGFTFETIWQPAGALAGDWFDFVDLGDGRHGVALADVSGKGMPAALLMSATRAILRSLARRDYSPGQTLHCLNQTLSEDFPAGKFVTMIYGVLDSRSREFTFASAGHLRPLLIDQDCRFLDVDTGLPLGLGASAYPEHTVRLEPGAGLLLYTDGITEAMNRDEEEFGAGRLLEHFLKPEACVELLMEEVRRFGHGSELADDATAVLIQSR